MTTRIYKFEQGRLLVHEERAVGATYGLLGTAQSGVPVRIGGIRQIEEVLSVTTDYAKAGLLTPLSEVRTSGSEIFVVMRRGDPGDLMSGENPLSGRPAYGLVSNITSGLPWGDELASGLGAVSNITVTANVIGY